MLPPCDAVLLQCGGRILGGLSLAALAVFTAARHPPGQQHGRGCTTSWLDWFRLALILVGALADWVSTVLPLSSSGAEAEGVSASAGFAILSWTMLTIAWMGGGAGMAAFLAIEVASAIPRLVELSAESGAAAVAPITATAVRLVLLASLPAGPRRGKVGRLADGDDRPCGASGWEREAREALLPPDAEAVRAQKPPPAARATRPRLRLAPRASRPRPAPQGPHAEALPSVADEPALSQALVLWVARVAAAARVRALFIGDAVAPPPDSEPATARGALATALAPDARGARRRRAPPPGAGALFLALARMSGPADPAMLSVPPPLRPRARRALRPPRLPTSRRRAARAGKDAACPISTG
jgi:hypothetical protein